MKQIATSLLASLFLTALLGTTTEAIASPLSCKAVHNSSAAIQSRSPLRELHDVDVQSFITSSDEMDILLLSNVYGTTVYKKSNMQLVGQLPTPFHEGNPKLLPALGAVATFTGKGELVLLDLKTQNLSRWNVLNLGWNKISSFDLSADGRILVIHIDYGYQIFDTQSRQKLASGAGNFIARPQISRDGQEVALLIGDTLSILETRTGKTLRKTKTDIYETPSARFSADGRILGGSQLNPNFASLIDVATGNKIGQVQGHITSFSADGRYVGVMYGAKTRIYDVKTQNLLAELPHKEMHWSSHFSADSKRFYVGLKDGTLLEYDLKSLLPQ